MTLVQLRHFISLAQTASVSGSTVALHVTQPALRRSIRALEDELGRRLFDRVGRVAERTPDRHQAVERVRDSGHGDEGVLRIGMGSGPGAVLMTLLLLAIRAGMRAAGRSRAGAMT